MKLYFKIKCWNHASLSKIQVWKVSVIKGWQLARQLAIYRAWRAIPAPWLDNSLTNRVSVEVYEKQNSSSVLTPIFDYVFGLSFLTILDI